MINESWYKSHAPNIDARFTSELIRIMQPHAIRTKKGESGERSDVIKKTDAIGQKRLAGILTMREAPNGLVNLAHGSGSSRFSVRNRYGSPR
jgi:hypothetical protein